MEDKNRNITIDYNVLGLPRHINQNGTAYSIDFMYDAAGNKLQKYLNDNHICPPNELCAPAESYAIDYIGNFVYERGEIKMIYHPEGVLRRTPSSGAENETEFVYDYFIKDYLGNVRVVLTEEDAIYTEKFLATLEEVHREIENQNFDNLDETAQELPAGYPVNGSVGLNERIARLSAANGTEMGPAMVLPVRRGDKVSLSTEYFFDEDAPGATYDHLTTFVNEILIALASSGSGVLRLTENQLIELATGGNHYSSAIHSFLSSQFDTTDVSRPHAYLVWMLYDNNMQLIPQGSGAKRVTDPNELRVLFENDIQIVDNGYLYAYVSNGSNKGINFDNFLVTYAEGATRQINHYYPYGLTIAGIHGDYDDYLNKYTGKELQTGEFDPTVSTGLEMLDFGSRFYDPQVGKWFTPDPAEQFANPYLAIGNNPVMYVDPDGEFIIPHISFSNGSFDIGLTFGFGIPGVASAQFTIGHTFNQGSGDNTYISLSGSIGGFTSSIGYGSQTGYTAGFGFGFGPPGVNSNIFSVGFSMSENYGLSVNGFGFSYGEGGYGGFNPSMGFSYGYIPGSRGKEVPALYACEGCPFPTQYLPEIEVIGRREPFVGPLMYNNAVNYATYSFPHREPYDGFWGKVEYFFTGGIDNGYQYDWNGKPIGMAPFSGTAPVPGWKGPKNIKKIDKVAREMKRLQHRGQLPNGVKRIDPVNMDAIGKRLHNGQPEITLSDGRVINMYDGTWKHGNGRVPNKIMKWINKYF